MQSKTFATDNLSDLEAQLKHLRTGNFNPTFALVFVSVVHDLTEIVAIFNVSQITFIGCTTAGEIVDDALYEQQIGVMLLDLPTDSFQVFESDYEDGGVEKVGISLSDAAKNAFLHPAIIILSVGINIDGEKFTNIVKNRLGSMVRMFGGMAGDDLQLKSTYVLSNKSVNNHGLVALIVDNDKVAVEGMAYSGWEAIGIEHTITSAEGNTVYTINDEPALDVFIKYFGYYGNMSSDRDVATAQYPLQLMRDDGYSVLRAPLLANETERSILLAGGVEKGAKFRFSISPGFEVIDSTIDGFQDMKNKQTYNPDALLLFSCKGRHASLGPLIEDEIAQLHRCWNKPMLGFLSYGEIGCVQDGFCDYHNETCTLVTLKQL